MNVIEARAYAAKIVASAIPRYAGQLVILDDATIETAQSWIFTFALRQFLNTRDRRFILFGTNAIEIGKDGGDRGFVPRKRLMELRINLNLEEGS